MTLLALSAKVSVMCSPVFHRQQKQRAGAENTLLSLSTNTSYMHLGKQERGRWIGKEKLKRRSKKRKKRQENNKINREEKLEVEDRNKGRIRWRKGRRKDGEEEKKE